MAMRLSYGRQPLRSAAPSASQPYAPIFPARAVRQDSIGGNVLTRSSAGCGFLSRVDPIWGLYPLQQNMVTAHKRSPCHCREHFSDAASALSLSGCGGEATGGAQQADGAVAAPHLACAIRPAAHAGLTGGCDAPRCGASHAGLRSDPGAVQVPAGAGGGDARGPRGNGDPTPACRRPFSLGCVFTAAVVCRRRTGCTT